MIEFKKDLRQLKVDVTKNQDLLNDIIDNLKYKNKNSDEMYHFDRSNLNVPVQTLADLKALEENDDNIKILVSLILKCNIIYIIVNVIMIQLLNKYVQLYILIYIFF